MRCLLYWNPCDTLDRTVLFIMQRESRAGSDCNECNKKDKLIDKYLNLIDLLKKKHEKSQVSSTLKRSIDCTVQQNQTHLSSKVTSKTGLAFLLSLLVLRRIGDALNRIKTLHLQKKCHRGYLLTQAIEKLINRRVSQALRKMSWDLHSAIGSGRENLVLEQQRKMQVVDGSISRNVSYCSMSLFLEGERREKVKRLTRKVFQLSQELIQLRHQKKISDEQIQQNYRRQEVESKKKKESLEMLAEDMAEKNQTIAQLQAALKFYEAKEGRLDNNVLEEDSLTMKREIEKMEKLNEKLGVQLEKKSDQLRRNEEELALLRERLAHLEIEFSDLKEKNFEMGLELQSLQKKKLQYNNLSLFLEKKLTNLKRYEKVIAGNLKLIDQASADRSSFNSTLKPRNSRVTFQDPPSDNLLEDKENKDFSPITRFESQYKIQKILNYLYNIDLEDVWINNEEKLFDPQELAVLNDVKLKFTQLAEEIKSLKAKNIKADPKIEAVANSPARLSRQCGESDEIYFNEQHVSGSIFDVFASEKAGKEKEGGKPMIGEFQGKNGQRGCSRCEEGGGTTRRADQGFTIKLLELQLQKNKQVEKISDLKNKLFHIRSIVMNFIKSLEFKSLRPESRDIVDLCFEFFEYSEEEKEIIFHTQAKKEKKFLGFF